MEIKLSNLNENPIEYVNELQCYILFLYFNVLFSDKINNMLVEQVNLYYFQRSQKSGQPYA